MTRDYARGKVNAMQKLPVTSGEYLSRVFYLFFIPLLARVGQGMFTHMEARGKLVCFWVLNSEDEVRTALQTNTVRSIMTDRPAAMRKFLDKL